MSTPAQKQLKQLIGSLKWADEMFLAADTADDVNIDGLTDATRQALEARRADVLCPERDTATGGRCVLSKMHRGLSPHRFDTAPDVEPLQ